MRRPLLGALVLAAAMPAVGSGQEPQPRPTFRASVQRVTLAASVRTKQGKPLTNLRADDFQLYDSGERRNILDFQVEPTPVSVGLLVDFSGSMGVAERRQAARDNVYQIISWLRPNLDEAGLYVFDKGLRELQPLAPAPGNILAQLDAINRPFGATSLFDAIAETGRIMAGRAGARRAVVAFTDGADNASRLTSAEVSGIASSIDVPVYIIVVVSPLDRMGRGVVDEVALDRMMNGSLADLARWTGGEIYSSIGPSRSSQAAQDIITDLRQQYLIAFEPSTKPGWHPVELRVRDKEKDLVVRTRGGYVVRDPEGL